MGQKLALFDVDSREGFGTEEVPGFTKLVQPIAPVLRRILQWARDHKVTVAATTPGSILLQPKVLDPGLVLVRADPAARDWETRIRKAHTVLLEKHPGMPMGRGTRHWALDLFERNPNAGLFVRKLRVKEWAVFGACVEFRIASIAGLLRILGYGVTILEDASVSSVQGSRVSAREALNRCRSLGIGVEKAEEFLRRWEARFLAEP